jgi:hypothetical protein
MSQLIPELDTGTAVYTGHHDSTSPILSIIYILIIFISTNRPNCGIADV